MNTSVATEASTFQIDMIGDHVRSMIVEFLNDYCHQLDDCQVDGWSNFFLPDGRYQITTRENEEAGYPLGIIYCEGRGMMDDRITALKTANVFESHVYNHILGHAHISHKADNLYRVRSNFIVHRTMYTGEVQLFASGKYLDVIQCGVDGLAFKERRVILDSRRVDTLMVMPI